MMVMVVNGIVDAWVLEGLPCIPALLLMYVLYDYVWISLVKDRPPSSGNPPRGHEHTPLPYEPIPDPPMYLY